MSTLGIHHLGLAVSKLTASKAFFTECLGWKVAKEIPAYPAVFVTNGAAFLTLWQTTDDATPFDRRVNVGLHHFALRVASEAELEAIFQKMAAFPGVVVDFAPEPLGSGPSKHCMVFEPSGLRVEFIWAP